MTDKPMAWRAIVVWVAETPDDGGEADMVADIFTDEVVARVGEIDRVAAGSVKVAAMEIVPEEEYEDA